MQKSRLLNWLWFAKDDAIWVLNYAFSWMSWACRCVCACIVIMQNFNWLCLVFQSVIIVRVFALSLSHSLPKLVCNEIILNLWNQQKSFYTHLPSISKLVVEMREIYGMCIVLCVVCNATHNLATNINK